MRLNEHTAEKALSPRKPASSAREARVVKPTFVLSIGVPKFPQFSEFIDSAGNVLKVLRKVQTISPGNLI